MLYTERDPGIFLSIPSEEKLTTDFMAGERKRSCVSGSVIIRGVNIMHAERNDYEEGGNVMSDWKSYYIYYYNSNNYKHIITLIADYCETQREEYNIKKWFFIRYWDGGPHIRLRILKNNDAAFTTELFTEVSNFIKENPSDITVTKEQYYQGMEDLKEPNDTMMDIKAEGSIVSSTYVPEIERYGGESLMEDNETIFMLSSMLASKILQKFNQQQFVLLLTGILVKRLVVNLFSYTERHELVGTTGEVIDFWSERNIFTNNHLIKFLTENKVVTHKLEKMLDTSEDILSILSQIKELLISFKVSVPKDYYHSIVISQIHMLCNRLGVTPVYEKAIYENMKHELVKEHSP